MGYDVWIFAVTAALIILDIATGIAKAAMGKTLSSGAMRQGLYHKAAFVGVIILAIICDGATGHMDLGFSIQLAPAACVYICLTEIASIIENLGEINPELKDSKLLQLFDNPKGE